jgi:hypothetical protein
MKLGFIAGALAHLRLVRPYVPLGCFHVLMRVSLPSFAIQTERTHRKKRLIVPAWVTKILQHVNLGLRRPIPHHSVYCQSMSETHKPMKPCDNLLEVLPPMQAPALAVHCSSLPSSSYTGYFQLQNAGGNAWSSAFRMAGFHEPSGPASIISTEWPLLLS